MKTRIESAILRNLLAETLRVYEESLGLRAPGEGTSGGSTGDASDPRRLAARASRAAAADLRGYASPDARAENAILRRLLVELSRAYEEGLEAVARERSLSAALLAWNAAAAILGDEDGRLVRLDAGAEGLTGWSSAEARGRPLAEVVRLVAEDGTAARLELEPCLAGGRSLTLRQGLRLEGRDGVRRTVAGRAAPLRGGDGRIVGVALLLRSAE